MREDRTPSWAASTATLPQRRRCAGSARSDALSRGVPLRPAGRLTRLASARAGPHFLFSETGPHAHPHAPQAAQLQVTSRARGGGGGGGESALVADAALVAAADGAALTLHTGGDDEGTSPEAQDSARGGGTRGGGKGSRSGKWPRRAANIGARGDSGGGSGSTAVAGSGRAQGALIGLQRALWPVESALAGGLMLRRGAAWLWTALVSMALGVLQNMVLCAPAVPVVLLGGLHQLRALSLDRALAVVALFVAALLGLAIAWVSHMPYAGRYLLFYLFAIFGVGGAVVLRERRLRRYARFLWWVVPIYVHYRAAQHYARSWELDEDERKELYEELHRTYAPRAYAAIVDLRGWFVKVGQIVSTFNMLMPKPYCRAFEPLQDGLPPRGRAAVRKMVTSALGEPPEVLFSEFDYEPLGAASIGQAHRARLLSGREVVVKVQYPDAQELFELDFECCIMFCRVARPDYADTLVDMKNSVSGELDFRTEAANLARCAANLTRMPREPGAPRVAIPRPVPGLASEHVLVMDYFRGVKLIDGVKDHLRAIAARMNMTLEQLVEKGKDAMVGGEGLGGDGAGGGAMGALGSRLGASASLALLLGLNRMYARTTNIFVNTGIALYNVATGAKAQYRQDLPAIDPSALFETLVAVHGRQVLLDGLFNADPHPGNVLLMQGGAIGLIDYGQVKELSLAQRLGLCRLVLAADAGDTGAIMAEAAALGLRTLRQTPDVIVKHVLLRLDQGNDAVKGCNPAALEKADPLEACPEELNWVSRLSVILWGTGLVLGMRADLPRRWAPLAREALRAAEEMEDLTRRRSERSAMQGEPLATPAARLAAEVAAAQEQPQAATPLRPLRQPSAEMSGLLAGGGNWSSAEDLQAAAAGAPSRESHSDSSGYASAEDYPLAAAGGSRPGSLPRRDG